MYNIYKDNSYIDVSFLLICSYNIFSIQNFFQKDSLPFFQLVYLFFISKG